LPDPNLTYEELRRIVELIHSTEQFSEFRLKVGEIEIELRRRRDLALAPPPVAPLAGGGEATAALPPPTPGVAAHVEAAPLAWPEGCTAIRSPMVGTFYRAPAPGAPPFVEVGQKVEPGTTVCMIEVMKLMNSIPAGARGLVAQILANDTASVDVGQPLILLQPE
jgi:acetyl-CoA carboxylase biotin carboxyl carrier protein